MMSTRLSTTAALAFVLGGMACTAHAQSFTEGFDNGASFGAGWITTNNSMGAGNDWVVGTVITFDNGEIAVRPHAGFSFAIVNFSSLESGRGTISNWLLSPLIANIQNGDTFSFFTTTVADSGYADRLELRLSTAGAGTDVGSTADSVGTFSSLLLSINPDLSVPGYPEEWTRFTATVGGLAAPVDGRVGLRYFVEDGGPAGENSDVIGVDSFSYVASAVPEPATWALMLMGAAGLAGLQRRRRTNA